MQSTDQKLPPIIGTPGHYSKSLMVHIHMFKKWSYCIGRIIAHNTTFEVISIIFQKFIEFLIVRFQYSKKTWNEK